MANTKPVKYPKFVGVSLDNETYEKIFNYAEWRKTTISQVIRHIVSYHFRIKKEDK